jgi:hypothetical protein
MFLLLVRLPHYLPCIHNNGGAIGTPTPEKHNNGGTETPAAATSSKRQVTHVRLLQLKLSLLKKANLQLHILLQFEWLVSLKNLDHFEYSGKILHVSYSIKENNSLKPLLLKQLKLDKCEGS